MQCLLDSMHMNGLSCTVVQVLLPRRISGITLAGLKRRCPLRDALPRKLSVDRASSPPFYPSIQDLTSSRYLHKMSLKVPKAGGPDLFKAGYKVGGRASQSCPNTLGPAAVGA